MIVKTHQTKNTSLTLEFLPISGADSMKSVISGTVLKYESEESETVSLCNFSTENIISNESDFSHVEWLFKSWCDINSGNELTYATQEGSL